MACDITLGRLEPCKDSIGGIDTIYFINFGELGLVTVAADDEITDMEGTFDAFKYDLKGVDNTLDEAGASSRDTGTTFFTQTLSTTLKQITKEMNNQLKLLMWGRPHIVVVDRNGNARMCGLERGCEVLTANVLTGGAMGDLNGYTLSSVGEERAPANFLAGATIADPFAGMASATVTIVEGA